MILFYDKVSKKIIGTIEGRMHDKHTIEKVGMHTSDIPSEQVGKIVVPFVPIFEEIEEAVKELRVLDPTGRVGEVITGTRKVQRAKDYEPDVSYKEIIIQFERGEAVATSFYVKTDEQGKVIGLSASSQ